MKLGLSCPVLTCLLAARQAPLPYTALRGGSVAMQEAAAPPIPITLLSGFLGSGKTTLLKHVLQNTEGLKVGVVVNDVASVNIDAKLVQQNSGQGALGDTVLPEDMVELSNGCACCSAGDDLFGALAALLSTSFNRGVKYDHIVLEASGVAEPRLLRGMFQEAAAAGWPLMRMLKLESMITVVDASSFLELYSSMENVHERKDLGAEEEDPSAAAYGAAPATPAPTVVQLLVEQVETSDVIVLNKIDGVDEAGLAYLKSALSAINGFAELCPTTFGVVSPSRLLMSDREAGVALSNEVMDHQSSVDFARWLEAQNVEQLLQPQKEEEEEEEKAPSAEAAAKHSHSHEDAHSHSHKDAHDHGHADACDEPACTDPSHDHSHSHEHSSDAHSHEHSHAHAHEHSHDGGCDDPACTDPSHDHSHNDRQDTTAAQRFGITTFVYSRRRPFHSKRFVALLGSMPFTQLRRDDVPTAIGLLSGDDAATPPEDGPFSAVVRSKGFVWLDTESSVAVYWSQAGKQIEVTEMGKWWAAVDRTLWPALHMDSILADCEGEWGDRRQELVFIGAGMAQDAIVDALDACLLTDEEMEALGAAPGSRAAPTPAAATASEK